MNQHELVNIVAISLGYTIRGKSSTEWVHISNGKRRILSYEYMIFCDSYAVLESNNELHTSLNEQQFLEIARKVFDEQSRTGG